MADPNLSALQNQALEKLGYTYRVPQPSSPLVDVPAVPGAGMSQAVDTAQPLTPEEQAYGAALAQQNAAVDASVDANPSHAVPVQEPLAPSIRPGVFNQWAKIPESRVGQENGQSTPGLDWQPGQRADYVPPGARMSLAQASQQQPAQQQLQASQAPSLGGGIRLPASPITGMLKQATADKNLADSQRTQAEIGADFATEQRKMNAEDLGESQGRTLEGIAQLQREQAAAQDQHLAQLDQLQAAHESAYNKVNAERNDLTKFISDWKPKDQSLGKKVAGALAVGLSGMVDQNNLVAGMIAGRPVVTDNASRVSAMIQRGIDRDLQQQQMLLDNKRTALAAKTTELGQLREKFGDNVNTLQMARVMKLDQAQKQIEAMQSQGQSEQARILGQEASAQLEQEKQRIMQQVWEQRYQQAYGEEKQLKMAQYNEKLRAAAAAAGPSAMDKLKLDEQRLKNAKLAQELNGGSPDKELTDKLNSYDSVIDVANKIKKTRAENPVERGLPGWLPGVTAPAKLEAQASDLDLLLKEGKKLGTLDKGSVEFLEKMRGDPASWSSDADVRLNEIIRSFENAKARALGKPTPDQLAELTRQRGAQ